MTMLAFILILLPDDSVESSSQTAQVEKEIVYKKETFVDLSGSQVDGENQLPPAFFVTKKEVPSAKSLLEERLNFKLRHYNDFGF